MLKKYCHETGRDWDEGVPFVLFAIRDAKQESLGFSQAELVFGHNVRGPLKVLKEKLVFLSHTWFALTARISGPYVVDCRVSDTDYIIRTPERRRKTR